MALNPLLHSNLLYWIPPRSSNPSSYFSAIDGTGTTPTNDGDPVGTILTGIGGVSFNASSTGVRPTIATAASGDKCVAGASGLALRHNSASYANSIHVNRRVFVIVVFQMDANFGLASRPFFDNTNSANNNGTNVQGLTLGIAAQTANGTVGGAVVPANSASGRLRIKNQTSTPLIELITEEGLSEASPTRRVMIGYIDPAGLSSLRIDRGRTSYGRVSGVAGSGNAAFAMFMLNRNSLGTHLPGKLISAGIYSDHPGQAAVDEWLAEFPLGNLVGSPEVRVGDYHCNLSRTNQFIPYCIWYKGQRVSPMSPGGGEDGEGLVFNDNVNGGPYNDGWRGGPHLNETLVSCTVSINGATPVAAANGETYEGNKVQVVRETVTGISFNTTQTHTWEANSQRVHILLTRLNDGRTIDPLYIARHSAPFEATTYKAYGIDGSILQSGTISTTTNSLNEMPEGTIAVAQWNSTINHMTLRIMTKGYALNHRFVIIDDTYNKRIYNRIYDATTNGQTLEAEFLSKHYETTSGEWEALALSELMKVLYPASGGGSRILGLGIGPDSLILE